MIIKFFKVFLYLILFLGSGEFLVKLDIKYNLTYINNQKVIKTNSKVFEVFEFDNINLKLKENQSRIMIIGDSYIEGIGINETLRFKNQLNEFLLKNSPGNKEHIILSLSAPGHNAIDKYFSFLKYYNLYQPNIILWFHTINDLMVDSLKIKGLKEKLITFENILGDASEIQILTNNSINNISKNMNTEIEPVRHQLIIHKLENIIAKSCLLNYLKENIFNELLLRGILIPYGDFFDITQNLYKDNRRELKIYKLIFEDILNQLNDDNVTLVLYSMPEYNLINQPKYFRNIDTALFKFFSNKSIIYIDGKNDLTNHNFDEVCATRSDGHPNSFAHKIITDKIGRLILNGF